MLYKDVTSNKEVRLKKKLILIPEIGRVKNHSPAHIAEFVSEYNTKNNTKKQEDKKQKKLKKKREYLRKI